MATLQDYLGITKLRDAWPKWKANVITVNNQVINHVAGTADKHASQDITYTGGFAGKTEVKAALDQAKLEIDTIVVSASIDPEVAFARESLVKAKTFATLDARLEESEQDLVSHEAETVTEVVNVKTGYNAIGDGVTNDHTALQNCANASSGKVMILPSGTYYNSSVVSVPANTKVIGYNAIIKGDGFSCAGDNISFYGVKFKANTGIGTYPEDAISVDKCSGITIDNCIFDQTRILLNNDADSDAYGEISVTNNEFSGDWSGYTEESNSNLIYVRGYTDVIISNNKFKTTGSNRFLKITCSTYYTAIATGIGISKRITIANNIFKGACTKQVMDLYAGTDEIVIDGNVINVTGCTDVIEDKVGGAGQTSSNTHRNILISNNTIIVDSAIVIAFQGAYGLTFAGDEQLIKIVNNIIRSTHATPTAIIGARGFHYVDINNNSINLTGDSAHLFAIDCRACKNLSINNNQSNKGSIQVFETGSTNSSLTYASPLYSLIINNNMLREARSYGGIYIRFLTQGNISITGNFIQTSNIAVTLATIYIRDSIIDDLSISGNFGINNGDTALNKLSMVANTISRYSHINNSWQKKTIESTMAPTTGTWTVGDKVYNSNPGQAGTAGSKYIITGWLCVTAGTPGTWLEMRSLTGN